MKWTDWLTKYRNVFLLVLLVGTLCASSLYQQQRLEDGSQRVSIPVIATGGNATDPLAAYRQTRDSAYLADKASLERLCDQDALDRQTREHAADRLQALVTQHQAALALEGALLTSDLAPCVAVVTAGSVTVVTGKEDLTDQDSALVLSMAKAHADASPADVQIITAR